jgi:hypothetical protein
MIMKTISLIISLISFALVLQAQSNENIGGSTHFKIGYSVNQFQHDFGIGVNLTSPYFLKQSIALKASGNLNWLQNIPLSSFETTWTNYQSYRLGITSKRSWITNTIAIYGEGGLTMIIPNKKFSGESVVMGGYGVFGFEFYVNKRFNYFIELGGIGTGATAEKATNKPIYSNGFITSVGFRVSL